MDPAEKSKLADKLVALDKEKNKNSTNDFLIKTLKNTLAEEMRNEGLDSFESSGGVFFLTKTLIAAPIGDRRETIEALKNNGYGHLVVETINSKALARLIDEHYTKTGELLPKWLEEKVILFEKVTLKICKK